jgi:hypothetical protein
MSVGVDTGLDRRTKKTTSPPSKTAVENSDAVWKHLRTFAQNSFIRAFPPTVRHIIEPAWGCDLSQSHYVLGTKWKKGDRFVANLSRPSNESLAEGEVNGDVNARSPDLGYDEVQADYIDNVVRDFVLFLKTDGKFTTTKMIQIEADIKAAFKCVVLSLKSMGTLCVEMDDWIMVYTRTAFGWKYATHTWSPFAKAIKQKVRKVERNGWGGQDWPQDWRRFAARLSILKRADEKEVAAGYLEKWRMAITFYVCR